ncbi:hypothetical protein HA402_011271 [Bradysia odoriphaga]|nr:hypothetical protein HA402_011271 [Bradysia odoriphaga]
MIATIWGILRAGLVCVPLDVSYPAHRLALILEAAQPYRVVAHPEHAHIAPGNLVILVEEATAEIEPMNFPAPDLDDLALLLFTSGSTGRPKGVELPHRMWANYTQWQLRVPSGARLDPSALLQLLDGYRVQRVLLPFVALQQLAEASNALGTRPRALRVVISSGGDCLALGYRGAPELTEERFFPHPWRDGSRLYRTGDLGRVLANGDVIWLGRADSQVKVRGFRIEPAEVELAIMRQAESLPGIRGAAVIARNRNNTDAFLAAFLIGDRDCVDIGEVKKALRNELPDYMVPSYFVWVDEFSLTPSGKRDDAALRVIPLVHETDVEQVAPRDDYERALVELLSELLNVPITGVHDNFFAMGGTSLTAMRLMLTLEKRYGVDIPIAALIEKPTVEGLAERLRARSAVLEFDPLVPIRTTGHRPPLFLVHPLGGHVLCYLSLAKAMPADQPVYALQAAGSGQGSTPLLSIEAMASEYLAAIRRVQPEGPYYLGGWSLGGFVAFEMARQLIATDPGAVAQLIVLDSIAMKRDSLAGATDDALLQFFYWELVWFER